MTIQQREEDEYRWGMASEHQNAFSLSCIDRKPDDSFKIKQLIDAGRFVVVAWQHEYCRFTDAPLPGRRSMWVADFATRDEAEALIRWLAADQPPPDDGDAGYSVEPPVTLPYVEATADFMRQNDEIPF